MKPANAKLFSPLYTAILLAAAAALAVAIGCSTGSKAKPVVLNNSQPIGPMVVKPDAPKTVAFTAEPKPVTVADKSSSPAKPQSKYVTFKSRDYGVSFDYPWQYTKLGAKAIASDYSLQPQSDGLESQITLARVDVPKGFYPDTDFDSGYFTLSLNPELSADECKATLKDAKAQNINGVDFSWKESENGGKGSAAKVRNYVAYVNDTCYEIETGVKTTNDGLSREVDPDQVMKRLDAMVMSVKIKQQPVKEVTPVEAGK